MDEARVQFSEVNDPTNWETSSLAFVCATPADARKAEALFNGLVGALERVRQDINWMLNSRQFLNPEVFDYLDAALQERAKEG